MPETDHLDLPYPDTNDLATVPAHMQALAEATEGQLIRAGARAKRCFIEAEQSTSSATPVVLGTPDRIEVTLDAPGLVFVAAFWVHRRTGEFGGDAGHAIYIDGSAKASGSTSFAGGATPAAGLTRDSGIVLNAPVDSSQALVPLAFTKGAGTFDVELRFSTPSGPILVSERYLLVWTQEFEDVSP